MLNDWSLGFQVINETQDFSIVLNPAYNPFEKDIFSYYLVFKKYNTVEACANSIIVIHSFLEEAQSAYNAMLTKQKKESEMPQKDDTLVH